MPLGPDLAGRFHDEHEHRYGWAEPGRPVELVAVRTADVRLGPQLTVAGPAHSARGPAVLELDGATVWVPAGWSGSTDPHGTLVLERR